MRKCEIILTDSGGVQEAATAPPIRKPVLVLRLSTERSEAVEAGFAKLVGVNRKDILKAIKETLENREKLPESSPYGNGNAAERIVKILESEITASSF